MNEPHDIPDINLWAASVQAAVTAIRNAGYAEPFQRCRELTQVEIVQQPNLFFSREITGRLLLLSFRMALLTHLRLWSTLMVASPA